MDHLINWLWQSTFLAVAASVALVLYSPLNAATRHAIWWLVLAAVIAVGSLGLVPEVSYGVAMGVAPSGAGQHTILLPEAPDWMSATIVSLWLAWIVFSLARLTIGAFSLVALKRSVATWPADREARLATWSQCKDRGRPARLASTSAVASACMLGLRAPVIVIPTWMLETLDDEAIDQIVVHEWAHVQRRDDLAAFLQALVRTLIGWHPAIAWIDRTINFEREAACDEWVVSLTNDRRRYASSLTTVAARRLQSKMPLVPALSVPRHTQLARRVTRLLAWGRRSDNRVARMALTTAGVALLGSVAGLARVGGIGFATLSDGLAALPASPSVYWAASFQEPTAPLLQLSQPAFLPAPVDDRRRGEVTVETSDRSSGERATGTGPPEATVTSQPLLVSESHSPVAQPNELTELASAPIAFANLIPMAAPVSELQPLWSPALRVSDGAVQLSRQMSRGSRAAALSSGQFFARLGRSFAGASSQAERLASRGDDQQP